MVSPTGKLHTYRQRQDATVCGLKLPKRAGWVKIRGDFAAYVALADGRTCRQCEEGLALVTGPGA